MKQMRLFLQNLARTGCPRERGYRKTPCYVDGLPSSAFRGAAAKEPQETSSVVCLSFFELPERDAGLLSSKDTK